MDPYPGLRNAKVDFNMPFLRCIDCDLILFAVMRLLIKYAYTTKCDYGKFTISYVLKIPTGEVPFAISNAFTFREDGKDLSVYALIDQLVRKKAEDYKDAKISRINIRIYLSEMKAGVTPIISDDKIASKLWECIENKVVVEPKKARTIGYLVRPGDDLSSAEKGIETYFSEDYPDFVFKTFEERSNKMLFDFIERLAVVVRHNPSILTVYLHNLSRFDGILLLKYYASRGDKYAIKPLMRNHRLYQIAVYLGKKRLFLLRDSLTLLTSSPDNLAKNLSPQLGSKGTIQHDEVQVSNLIPLQHQLLVYMKQDILLLGGVMLKALEIYWTICNVDIVTKLTLSSLALTIFRTNYYVQNNWSIYIPNRNEDTFIRRGYYGGHSDAYIPCGDNLYYYDVNSLYPYIMKSYTMPRGETVWHGKLEGQDLDNLFGFIEAYVVCPRTISPPFLPYRDEKNQTLLFPIGKFVDVYYSEELKYARDIGYQSIPLSSYLFEKKNSIPFKSFVFDIFDRRQEAKRAGNDTMSYVYKILMNSLYGRFGINPKSTVTEIYDYDRYNYLIKKSDLILGDKLSEHYYIVSYLRNIEHVDDTDWNPPKIAVVQLSAAITACARIYMYKYISRPDCYYTDTDSVVLGGPLLEEEISSTVLGKFKLENYIKKGIFLAPKSYSFLTQEDKGIIKHKGHAKSLVDNEWFESLYVDISRTKLTSVESNFNIDWKRLNISKKETLVNLGIRIGNKREPVYDNNLWVDTVPLDVTNFIGQENRIRAYEVMRL
ncbi:DNA polymerase-like [Olea europaea subsp. europaea]|uniref:DNA polymerase n=1 Tax=Olea europaea subsp. europaea TaxID=158383 RepID=A0A8S0UMY8_OLEEU|nr:DNA polymerase-like [Olea europaea subsp. europaea]